MFVSIPKLPRQYPCGWAPSIPQREHVKNFSGRALPDDPVEAPDFIGPEPVELAVPAAGAEDVPEDGLGEVPEPPCWPD